MIWSFERWIWWDISDDMMGDKKPSIRWIDLAGIGLSTLLSHVDLVDDYTWFRDDGVTAQKSLDVSKTRNVEVCWECLSWRVLIILLTCWWVASATRIRISCDMIMWPSCLTRKTTVVEPGKHRDFSEQMWFGKHTFGIYLSKKWFDPTWGCCYLKHQTVIEGPMRTSKSPFGFFGIPTFLRHIFLDTIGFPSRIATPALQRCKVRFQTTKDGFWTVLIEVKLSSQSHSIPVQSALTSLTLY